MVKPIGGDLGLLPTTPMGPVGKAPGCVEMRQSFRFSLGLAQFEDSDMTQVSSLLALMALIGFAVVEVATRVFT